MNTRFLLKLLCLLFSISWGVQAHAQPYYVFIGSYNYDKAKPGIYVYAFDTATGNLVKISEVAGVLNPSFLTVSGDGRYLYACTESRCPGMGSVSGYAFNRDDGKLTFLNSQRSGGENPVYLAIDKTGKWLVNANYTDGSASVYPLERDGSIGPVSQRFTYRDSSIDPDRQDRSHIHQVVFAPGNDFVYLPDLGADKIRCYTFDPSLAEPLQHSGLPFARSVPGSGTRHLTFHPNGRFVYCIDEMAGCITAFRYEKGRLDRFQRVAAHTSKRTRRYSSADVQVSPDGRFLYATNRGRENNIAVFAIAADGTLDMVARTSVNGNHPRDFEIDPTGRFLIVVNQLSGNVVVFRRDAETGLLTETGIEVAIPGASCVYIKKY